MKKTLIILSILAASFASLAQTQELDSLTAVIESNQHDTLRIKAALTKAQLLEISDYKGAKESAYWALSSSKKIEYQHGIYEAYYSLASMHYENNMGMVMLQYIDSMMTIQSPSITDTQRGDAYNLLGIAHYTEGDLVKAIDAWKRARDFLPPSRQAGVISNIGNIYLSSDEMEKALGWFLEAAAINERDSVYHYLAMNYYNIASCYPHTDTLHLHYLRKSFLNIRRVGYIRLLPAAYVTLMSYHVDNRQLLEAAAVLDSLEYLPDGLDSGYVAVNKTLSWTLYRSALGMELLAGNSVPAGLPEAERPAMDLLTDASNHLASITDGTQSMWSLYTDNQRLAEIYRAMGDYQAASERYRLSLQYKDTLAVNKAQFILKEYERDQEAAQQIEAELRQANERQRQQFRFNTTLSAGGLILALAIALWSRLRYTRRTNGIITKEKERSEKLLLNILPEEVAEELKEKGHTEAQLIDHVTVLFTDFKGFTALAEQVTPKELVEDLHTCFTAFDNICEKYGIEKIKTIGDAYMAAGGLPTPNDTHPMDAVHAAIEMRDFVEAGKARKIEAGLPYFEIRIGIHTGPVVAGIVGVKKFQYDIWGDTVNTASRMESSGDVGRVNISQSTYELLKDDPDFTFESRGKIEAKGKGEIEMFFVTKA